MRTLLASLPAALLIALSTPVAAGPLAETARGIDNKVETHNDSNSGPSQSDDSSDNNSNHDYYDESGCIDCSTGVAVAGSSDGITILTGPGRLDLYLGGHSVVGSQGALVGEVRASKEWLGISASNTSYFERIEDKQRTDSIRLDLMAFALNARLFHGGASELWIDGGLGATSSSEYDAIFGTVFGVRGEHRLHPQLAVVGQARMFSLEADVSAFEGWAGMRAWFLSAGYRVVRFNVGPALHGPEAGLFVRF